MRKSAILGIAAVFVALAGCKNKQQKFQELSDRYALAGNTMAADCPMVPDAKGSYQVNRSAKCVEEGKHYEELHQQLLQAQREASQ